MFSDPQGGRTNGYESDLKTATELAAAAVGQWGMDPAFHLLSMDGLPEGLRPYMGREVLERI